MSACWVAFCVWISDEAAQCSPAKLSKHLALPLLLTDLARGLAHLPCQPHTSLLEGALRVRLGVL